MNAKKAVILAGGNIEILRDQLDIRSILLIVSYGEAEIRDYFRDGQALGVEIQYARSNPGDGIADALWSVRDKVGNTFVVMLGDEFYLNSNHRTLKQANYENAEAVVAFTRRNSPQEIARNYSLSLDEDLKVLGLREKPRRIENDLLGLGTFVLKDSVFEFIERTPLNPLTRRKELIDVISTGILRSSWPTRTAFPPSEKAWSFPPTTRPTPLRLSSMTSRMRWMKSWWWTAAARTAQWKRSRRCIRTAATSD